MFVNTSESGKYTTTPQAIYASARLFLFCFDLKSELNFLCSYCTISFLFAGVACISLIPPLASSLYLFSLTLNNPIFFHLYKTSTDLHCSLYVFPTILAVWRPDLNPVLWLCSVMSWSFPKLLYCKFQSHHDPSFPSPPSLCYSTNQSKCVSIRLPMSSSAWLTCFWDVLPGHIAAWPPDIPTRRGTEQIACLTVYEQGCWTFCRV